MYIKGSVHWRFLRKVVCCFLWLLGEIVEKLLCHSPTPEFTFHPLSACPGSNRCLPPRSHSFPLARRPRFLFNHLQPQPSETTMIRCGRVACRNGLSLVCKGILEFRSQTETEISRFSSRDTSSMNRSGNNLICCLHSTKE